MSQHYAIVFRRDFAPGEHWHDHLPAPAAGERHQHGRHRAPDHDVDRRQHWRTGDVYSTGTVVDHDALPAHLEAIPCDPPTEGQVWDAARRGYVDGPPAPRRSRAARAQAALTELHAALASDE